MDFAVAEYAEINILGMSILCILLAYELRAHRAAADMAHRYFDAMILINIALLFLDTVIELIQGHTGTFLRVLDHVACFSYFVLHVCFGLVWLLYCAVKLLPNIELKKARFWLSAPIVLCVILMLISIRTGWVYSLGADNSYHRGPLLAVVTVLTVAYWLASVWIIVRERMQPKRARESGIYTILLIFPIPTILGLVIQIGFFGISLIWVCTALSLMILFINLQNEQISRDTLTGVFSRRQIDIQMNWEISHRDKASEVFFAIVVNVDRFKRINEHFGHIQGDQALIQVAHILQESCRAKDFIGRMGGDEFIVFGNAESAAQVDALVETILEQTKVRNEARITPYKLSLSAGQVCFDRKELLSVDKVITEAYIRMYAEKALKRA